VNDQCRDPARRTFTGLGVDCEYLVPDLDVFDRFVGAVGHEDVGVAGEAARYPSQITLLRKRTTYSWNDRPAHLGHRWFLAEALGDSVSDYLVELLASELADITVHGSDKER
jgi:hypothetical protein